MFTGVLAIIALAFVFWLVEVIRAKIAGRPTSWQQYEQARALSGDETVQPASPVDAALDRLPASPERSAWVRRLMLLTLTVGLG